MNPILITNNPMVYQKITNINVIFLKDSSLLEILIKVRDEIHRGAKLLTHPLTGSIKPNESPFKSILISRDENRELNLESLNIISNSIEVVEKFLKDGYKKDMPIELMKDFQTIDLAIIESGVKNLGGRDGESL